MIIETSDNRFYRVTETDIPALDHCWNGQRVKKVNGAWELTARAARKPERQELIRKAATRIVEQ